MSTLTSTIGYKGPKAAVHAASDLSVPPTFLAIKETTSAAATAALGSLLFCSAEELCLLEGWDGLARSTGFQTRLQMIKIKAKVHTKTNTAVIPGLVSSL